MVKNHYEQPSTAIEEIDPDMLICASADITSEIGIFYGGVDVDGTKTVDSRFYSAWDDEFGIEVEW